MFKRKFYYSQDELSDQIGAINDLMKLREKSQQLATVHLKTDKHATYLKELVQSDDNIAIAQQVLGHMLEKNVKGKR